MLEAVKSPYLVPFAGDFKLKQAPTSASKIPSEKTCKDRLKKAVKRISQLQRILYANDKRALLLVFQAMDAAGKDSTIRAILSGVNPAGCQVFSFKQPSKEELDHDFLWRTYKALPERGRIGVFNRSYYEDVLVVRVHPEFLNDVVLEHNENLGELWEERYQSINHMEQHLARNGTVILKFWLNVSKQEQKNRFLARLQDPEKNWKFSEADITERGLWTHYMQAYHDALNATSKPWAPWYAIPADDKPYMRMRVAEIVQQTLEAMRLTYPQVDERALKRFKKLEQQLLDDKV